MRQCGSIVEEMKNATLGNDCGLLRSSGQQIRKGGGYGGFQLALGWLWGGEALALLQPGHAYVLGSIKPSGAQTNAAPGPEVAAGPVVGCAQLRGYSTVRPSHHRRAGRPTGRLAGQRPPLDRSARAGV